MKLKHITRLALSLALALSVPAFASDYSFSTTAPQDYYKSTSYEDVYDARYNYGGKNVTDFQVQETVYGYQSTTMTGVMERAILSGLQESVMTGGGGYSLTGDSAAVTIPVGSTGTVTTAPITTAPVATPTFTYQQPAYTSVQGMAYQDGSIGTVKIPKLGLSVKVWGAQTTPGTGKNETPSTVSGTLMGTYNVHGIYPFKLCRCFQGFGHALALGHLSDDALHALAASLVRLGKMLVKRSVQEHGAVEGRPVLPEIGNCRSRGRTAGGCMRPPWWTSRPLPGTVRKRRLPINVA